MVGEIKGYCLLKSIDNVFIGMNKAWYPKEYAEIEQLLLTNPVRIIDIGVDNSGFLVLEPKARCICDVRNMDDVQSHFLCDQVGDVLIPPGLSELDKMLEMNKRTMRKGGYNDILRRMVVINSLRKNKFDDDFLFAKQ